MTLMNVHGKNKGSAGSQMQPHYKPWPLFYKSRYSHCRNGRGFYDEKTWVWFKIFCHKTIKIRKRKQVLWTLVIPLLQGNNSVKNTNLYSLSLEQQYKSDKRHKVKYLEEDRHRSTKASVFSLYQVWRSLTRTWVIKKTGWRYYRKTVF